ncbi:hypothetical protein ACFW04_002426 [Cataglyphis niger]
MPRSTPKSKRNESRRSSILKPRKPRQPLQNVNFDSPHNERSSTPSKSKRRVSFADKKHVKEFCHSTEQGTVWDNTYEEHDSSLLKGSFVVDAKTESKENVLCIPNNECVHMFGSNSNSCSNSSNLTNNQLSESNIRKDNDNCDLNFTNPINGIIACSNTDEKYVEKPNGSQLEQNVMSNVVSRSHVSRNATSSNIIIYKDSNEEKSASNTTNAFSTSHVSKNGTSSNIIIYRDSDKKNADNAGIKLYSELCCNVDSELDKTSAQDFSMEFTTPVYTSLPSLSSLHAEEEINVQKDECALNLNLSTKWIGNCNNMSSQAVPTSVKPINSGLGIFEQISKIQKHESSNCTTENNNTHNTIFSTSLQSNIVSKNNVFKHIQDATQNVNESMILTNIIQPSIISTDICHTNNTAFNASMEMTTAISTKIYNKNISHPHDENIIKENNLKENQTDKTEFFNDVMEITKPINTFPLIAYDKENLKMDELISKDDSTVFFHDVSMEMTKSLKNQEEIIRPIINRSIPEESTYKENNMDNLKNFDEKTRLLYKSMEITEAVPVSLHHERTLNTVCTAQSTSFSQTRLLYKSMEITEAVPVSLHHDTTLNTICTAQSTSFSQTMPKARLPVENSTELISQADTAANKTIQNVSMEITDTVLSTLCLTQDVTNERENLNISRNNEIQHSTTNNLIKLRKNATNENSIISREFIETTDMHNELSNNFVIPSASSNLDHSLIAVSKNISSRNETFDKNEQPNSKKICKSFMESDTPQENNVCLSLKPNDIYINDIGYNECFVQNTMDHTGLSKSNFRDDLHEISECNLLKTLGNSFEELQSIKPPSFISLDSDKEENSFSDALCKNNQISTGDKTIDNVHNSSNQLIINNVPEYKAELKKSITKDNESSTVLRKNESINIENIQMEDCCTRTIANKIEQEDDCQAIRRIIINDNQVNESNHCTMNIKNLHAENVLSTQNNKHGETNTDHCKSPINKESEIIIKEQYIQEKINNDANPQNNVKEKEKYLGVQRLKIEQYTDRLKRIEAIENQLNSENNCKANLNDEISVTEMKQNEECIERRLTVERCVSVSEDESLTEQDPFLSLLQKLETHSERDDCIWNMYHKNIDRKMIVFGFISNSLLIAMYLSYDLNCSEENLIEKVKIISRVSDDSGVLVRIVHKLILEKLDAELLMYRCRTYEDILPMLEYVSEHVKLAMNFMFDLKHLDNLNLMEITYDHISFVSRSKQMDTILKVTIKVKRFDELTSKDVNVQCLLGTIRETDIKSLIKNIKKDHKFLRKYINDVKDYIDIMEETLIAKKV